MIFLHPQSQPVRFLALTGGFFVVAAMASTSCSGQIVASNTVYSNSYSQPVIQSASPVCPKCGRVHGNSSAMNGTAIIRQPSVGQTSASIPVSPASRSPASSGLRSSGGTSNVLSALNSQRARQGLGSLQYDPALQAVATRRAQLMASTGNKSHPPGSFSPGRYEGVGWSSSYSPAGVSACFTSDPNMRVAGAAMATGSDGVYFCVVYR